MINIKRCEGESDFEYKLRLTTSKLNRELDLDWDELVSLLDLECSADHLRKTAYGLKEAHEHYQKKMEEMLATSIEGDSLIAEIENKRLELEKEKIRFQDQRREFKKLLREYARVEHVQKFIAETAETIATDKPLLVDYKDDYDNNPLREGVALFSDWHVGLFVENYWNSFNMKELKRRVARLTEKIIEYGKMHSIKTLHTFLLGDLISGLIHITGRINSTEDVVRQTQITSELIAEVLTKFANEFEEVKVYIVRGNHDRISANKKDEIAKESFVDFIPWYLKPRLSPIKNIEIMENKYDDEIIVSEICGKFKVAGVHGHRDGVASVVQNLTLMTREMFDYIFMGHVHHNFSTEVHGIEVVVNPSLSGVDDYAKEIRKTSKPCQKFMIFDRDESLLNTYPIRLDI